MFELDKLPADYDGEECRYNEETHHKSKPLACPFCGHIPDYYVIGARLCFNDKGIRMVKCKNSACVLWDIPLRYEEWQKRVSL